MGTGAFFQQAEWVHGSRADLALGTLDLGVATLTPLALRHVLGLEGLQWSVCHSRPLGAERSPP